MPLDSSAALLFRIKGDATDAVRAFTETTAAEKQMQLSTQESSAAFSGMEISAGAVIGAVTGVVAILGVASAATIGLGKELFNLSHEAANYGSKIHDAAQQTGLNVESIQALKFAAEQSGSSFEKISGSVSKFSALLGEAKNGNEKALATLHQYHIQIDDTDVAMAQAIKTIASMRDHDQQAAAAKDLFRERTAAILPVIQSFDGDMPSLIEHLRSLGLLMSKDDTDAADKFGDQMDTLDQQLAAVWHRIGIELIPVFQKWSKELSGWLAQNQGEVKGWGDTIAALVDRLLKDAARAGPALRTFAAIARGDYIAAAGEVATRAVIENTPEPLDPNDTALMRYRNKGAIDTTDPEAAKKAADEAEKARREREEAAKKELQDLSERNRILIQGQRDLFAAAQKEWEVALEKGDTDQATFLDNSRKNVANYAENVRRLLKAAFDLDIQGKTPTEVENLGIQYTQAIGALNRQTQKAAADANKAIEDDNKRHEKELDKQLKEDEKRLNEQIDLWKQEGKAYADKVNRENELDKDRAKQEQELRDLNDADRRKGIDQSGRDLAKPVFDAGSIFDDLKKQFDIVSIFSIDKDGKQTIKDSAQFLQDVWGDASKMIGQALGNITQGLGDMLAAWIATGHFSAKAALQMASGVLIGLAIQSGIKAVFELAEGFAALANPFLAWTAPLHFAAAKLYGTVAGLAGAAGVATGLGARALGGGQTAGAANSTSAGSSSRGSTINQNPDPYSRTSGTAFDSGNRFDRQTAAAIDRHTQTLEKIYGTITSMRPGDVLARGAKEMPGLIGNAAVNDVKRDSSIGTRFLRHTGGS